MSTADIDAAVNLSARLMRTNLKRQAPRKTGDLRRSIAVSGAFDGNRVSFTITSLFYGTFVDLGTGPYRTSRRESWNPRPGKGRGGIRPRFWLTLNQAVYREVQKRIATATSRFIIISLFR